MTVDDPSERDDLLVEADWTSIGDDDDLWIPPVDLPPPLASPAPFLLNVHEMDWPAFECLVMGMARRLDGASDARRYGKPGQAQHGLDVVAFFAERSPSVYQAKRWEAFGADDLSAAVKRYAGGRRPFAADRLVVAVSSEARDTETIEKLGQLRIDHPDLIIELWDRAEISERLRNQPQLVSTFFGPATAAAFCVSGPSSGPGPAVSTSIEADAILRGPIAHLGLVDDVRRAEQVLGAQPDQAAALLAAVAERLERAGFVPHAVPVRELQAQALGASGRRAEEGEVRITLGWRRLAAGDITSVRAQLEVMRSWGAEIPPNVARQWNALAGVTGLQSDPGVTLDQVAPLVDALADDDPHRSDAVLAVAEKAVVARQPEIVQLRAAQIEGVAGSLLADHESQLIAARLRMCVADCCGGWEALAASARDTYPPGVAALVIARSARHLTLVPTPQSAVARWRDAIERACMAELNDDAADWLYALRAMRLQNSLVGPDINDLHRHAQALRAAGRGTLLPEAYSAHERGLDYLRDQKWPDAFEAIQRFLWRSVIGGSWDEELDAHELLGDLFAQTGRGREAVEHYVAAGKGKKLEAFAEALREEAVPLPIELISPRPWERTAAFEFAAACSELIVDDDARQWCAAAFREVKEHPQPAAFASPDPWLAGFAAFGQLAELSSEDDARDFLEISKGLLPREPGHYRFSDEAQVFALIGIGRAHGELQMAVRTQLLQAILADQRMAERTLQHGEDLLRSDPNQVAAALSEAAQDNVYAAMALVFSGADTTPIVPLARRRLDAAIAPRVHQPGQMSFGTGLPQTASLVTALPEEDRIRFAEGMLDFASDDQEPGHNRHDALAALRAIARYLPNATRSELFDGVLPFARGEVRDTGSGDDLFPGAGDLLRRFTVHIGDAALEGAGVMAAAVLAVSNEQYAAVERAAVGLLAGADELTLNSVAIALTGIPHDNLTLPVDVLAAHPSPWLRALAAVLWVRRTGEAEEIGLQLARDPSHHVRGSLAGGLKSEQRYARVREILLNDPRRSVRKRVGSGDEEAGSSPG
jgi:hypothetical protein